jgi:hypothetical protein
MTSRQLVPERREPPIGGQTSNHSGTGSDPEALSQVNAINTSSEPPGTGSAVRWFPVSPL